MFINFVDDNGESFLCLRHPHSFHKLLALTVFLWGLGQTAQAALGAGSDSPWRDSAWGYWLRITRGGAGGSVIQSLRPANPALNGGQQTFFDES